MELTQGIFLLNVDSHGALFWGRYFFIVYINNIVNSSILAKFIMFADDTNLFLNIEIVIRYIILSIMSYLKKN